MFELIINVKTFDEKHFSSLTCQIFSYAGKSSNMSVTSAAICDRSERVSVTCAKR